ncbi:hypothetical protein MRS44_011796 [Fusarium solani]|uniref:uncharacterized protein n=1 Tax=Fusarium solani TaxID=169388 RepID=UPI0032C426F4|nr:hypothetical protein MRS44_011796 [Fusarium solani]
MAPTARLDAFAMLRPVMALLVISVAVSTAWMLNCKESLRDLLMGPGILKRIMITMFVLLNWNDMPLAWTRLLYRPRCLPRTHSLLSAAPRYDEPGAQYLLTHFLPAGTAKPTSWLNPGFGKSEVRAGSDPASGWERKIQATAISKYVFKIGRFTVHPARILDNSGLLPKRPGGWIEGSEEQLGDMFVDLSDTDLTIDKEWDWRRVEAQRRKCMTIAARFHALDEAKNLFDGGENGALA